MQKSMRTICLSEADAERLGVLHRFVRNPMEGAHLERLEEKVAVAELLPPAEVPPDLVTMNSQVRLTDLATGQTAMYTLSFPACADARKLRISVLGALGTALLGSRVGDIVEYRSSAGPERCRVDEILYQPEAAGNYYG
jgi:regulator of nucleoside diphosphate kinase